MTVPASVDPTRWVNPTTSTFGETTYSLSNWPDDHEEVFQYYLNHVLFTDGARAVVWLNQQLEFM